MPNKYHIGRLTRIDFLNLEPDTFDLFNYFNYPISMCSEYVKDNRNSFKNKLAICDLSTFSIRTFDQILGLKRRIKKTNGIEDESKLKAIRIESNGSNRFFILNSLDCFVHVAH